MICSNIGPQQCAADSASPGPIGLCPLSGPDWSLQAGGSAGQPADEPGAARPVRDPSGLPSHSGHPSSPLWHAH